MEPIALAVVLLVGAGNVTLGDVSSKSDDAAIMEMVEAIGEYDESDSNKDVTVSAETTTVIKELKN